jgi:carbon storage regulator
MLVLSRKIGQSIVIDDDITITILDAGSGRVSLGIQAPKEKAIYRQELYEAIHRALHADGDGVPEYCAVVG